MPGEPDQAKVIYDPENPERVRDPNSGRLLFGGGVAALVALILLVVGLSLLILA